MPEYKEGISLYGHGNADKKVAACEYLKLATNEIVTDLVLGYSVKDGLNSIVIQTSLDREGKSTKYGFPV